MEAEARRLAEATEDEIANFMRKDYRGPPKAKRKPPINNHEPSNWLKSKLHLYISYLHIGP